MMYGAYSTSRRVAVSRIFLRFVWFSIASVFICFLYVYVASFFCMGFTKFLTLILPSPFSFFSSFCSNPPLWYCGITFSHVFCDRKALEDNSNQNSNSTVFRLYVVVLAIYAGVQFFVSFLLQIPACHSLTNRCDSWSVVRFIKWMHQVSHFLSDFQRMITFLCPWFEMFY